MNDKTQEIIELNMLLAHANRLELPEAENYQQQLENLLGDHQWDQLRGLSGTWSAAATKQKPTEQE